MIIYALLFWAIVNAEFAWAFFLVGLVGSFILSIITIYYVPYEWWDLRTTKTDRHILWGDATIVEKAFKALKSFCYQIIYAPQTWLLLGIYTIITSIIIYFF